MAAPNPEMQETFRSSSERRFSICLTLPPRRRRLPWSIDRYGRLIAGLAILAATILGMTHHPLWLLSTLAAATQLALSSLTNRCPLHYLLTRLGAREREELYAPGGVPRDR